MLGLMSCGLWAAGYGLWLIGWCLWAGAYGMWPMGWAKPCTGLSHSTISEKSSTCLGEGIILTHMVPDLAKWEIRVGGVLLFGASERPLNHPGVDLDDPMCPKPELGALRDGQIPPFYVKWWNLTIPKCTRLEFWTHRIVQNAPRVVRGPFRCSEKQHTSRTDLPSGRIGRHRRQNGALA